MRILIIEDEPKTAAYLSKGLRESGFLVDIALDGEEGKFLGTEHRYEVIILDVMLPKLNGWQVLKEIRKIHTDTRILFLTACDQLEDKVKGLEAGADDYLVKPFAFSEVLARVRTLLRRGSTQSTDVLEIGNLKIDLLKHKAFRNDQRIDLSPKEFSLLVYLAKNTGQVVTRTLIAENVWDINFDSDTNVVDVSIRRLRQKLDDAYEQKLIHSVRGVGYVLELR